MKIPESIKLSSLVQKPRYGSKINWVFNSGLKFSVSAGVLGAVGVILVIKAKRFINFTPSDQDGASSRFWAVPGLQNLGNNCFLNVVLQALASCSSFRKYLGEMLEEYGSSSVEGDEHIPLVNSLTSLVEELCTVRHQRTVLSPRKLMLVMDHYIPNFNLTRQQRPGCTLEDCLKKFFVAELVENYCCSNCWHTAAIDYLSGLAEDKANFPSPPRRHQTYRLISVVEHFGSSGGGHYTVYRKVTARLGDEDPVALLESTIEQWFCISDAEVHSVSERDVLDANASMLFYEKID
ncbi:UNVERIFIED_CONTAM: Ubiquitin carboxyl-terminal hydrolase 27 [Sesamum calycinum]|uniref:Ubiquitin carboxyl-terminal hydrolase 27 n=1 Tax=Sesamum calycinum TaxID=2727403 RepID=A0AAW2JAI8_9LAMI